VARIGALMDEIQTEMFDLACARRDEATETVDSWDDFRDLFPEGQSKFVYAHWCGDAEVEKQIKEETGGVTIRNIPVDQPAEPGKCIRTGRPSAQRVLFARAY
jgi:prolyl-tRNA synthetase